MESPEDLRRQLMVRRQLAARGICDHRVLGAMGKVPREEFVPAELAESAYDDGPLPIGWGQTISQPYIVALSTEALLIGPDDLVLDVGTGSGYAAAVMSRLAAHVVSIERIPTLAAAARCRLERLGYDNIEVVCGDGSIGWPGSAPYDAVCVSAAGPAVPSRLIEQLSEGGRLVMPTEGPTGQVLIAGVRRGDEFERREIAAVRFVPLLGAAGYDPPPIRHGL